MVLVANDGNDFVNIEKSNQQAFENVQPAANLLQPVLEPPPDGRRSIFKPLPEYGAQILDLRPAIDADHIQIDALTAFQIGCRKQVRHQGLDIDAV